MAVNSRRLTKAVVIRYRVFPWVDIPKAAAGSAFRFVGYESGEMAGIPEDAFRHMPRVAAADFRFSVYFQVCGTPK